MAGYVVRPNQQLTLAGAAPLLLPAAEQQQDQIAIDARVFASAVI
jgi:hypothetical protein